MYTCPPRGLLKDAESASHHTFIELERAFLPIVFTTLGGIGPPSACAWLDSLFHVAYTTEYLGGGTGERTAHQRLIFYQSLHAALTRACADMIAHLTPTSTAPPTSPTP